jgi:hypothetical protein
MMKKKKAKGNEGEERRKWGAQRGIAATKSEARNSKSETN